MSSNPPVWTLSILQVNNDHVFPIEIEATETVESLKAIIEVETNIALKEQTLSLGSGTVLENQQSLQSYGIQNHDIIQLKKMPPFDPSQPLAGINIQTISAEELQQYMRTYPPLWNHIQKNQPQLKEAVLHSDASKLDQFLAPLQSRQPRNFAAPQTMEQREMEMRRRLANNPNDAEAQRFLEQKIQQQNIQENMMNAMEHTPEAFGRVVMLYIDCKVNGNDIKAFVDSGAQMSVMSKRCAEKCGILRLMDTRFQGLAKGVGAAKILGRVHLTQMRIGRQFFNLSVTILDQDDMDFLLGLDMLRRHQCSINLKENCLRIGDEKAKFLSEGELPKNALGNEMPGTPATPGRVHNPFENSAQSGNNQQQDQQNQRGQSQQQDQQSAQISEDSIELLVEMGCSREQAINALRQTNGDPNLAASILFS